MANEMRVITERVDDIPVLMAQAVKMNVPGLLDAYFPTHGNWEGTSLGWTTSVWMAHILSEGDHRLNRVENWASYRESVLGMICGKPVRSAEWSDDRLGIVLDELSDDEKWQGFERALNRHILRVYKLGTKRVRVDSTTASGYWAVTEEGIFQFGHSKDHRPDLPQVKVMMSVLDPLGMPLVTQVVSGESADDPLYVPAIQEVSAGLMEHGLLYVGDCKMAALKTRATIQAQNDYYLCPISEAHLPAELLESYLRPIWEGKQTLTAIYREDTAGVQEHIAEGYELSISVNAEVNGLPVQWQERRLIVRSLLYQESMLTKLRQRLDKAQTELLQLTQRKQGKSRIANPEALLHAAEAILKARHVLGLFKLAVNEQVSQHEVRSYKGRPAHTENMHEITLHFERDQQAIDEAERRLGWRVYVTNHPQEGLALGTAILAYREEFLIERGFGRLKGHPLSITPMYLQSGSRVTALIRLLSICLRMLTLLEYPVRQCLAERQDSLAGLYAGNPKRATSRPTAEMMLNAFKYINLSVVTIGADLHCQITSLSALQTRILLLLDFPTDMYSHLVNQIGFSALNLTEP